MNLLKDEFWQKMMQQMSVANEKDFSKRDFLKDVCGFFDIASGFIYEVNHLGVFERQENYDIASTSSSLDKVDLRGVLGFEQLSVLCSEKIVIAWGDMEKTSLQANLMKIFNANTLIFIPILNQHYELAGFVGLADRRKSVRKENIDIETSCAVLSLLANNIKLSLYRKGIANTEKALSNVLDHIGIDIYVNDYYTHDILYVNKSMARPYGGVENMIGKKCWQSIFDDKTAPCDFCPQPKLVDENGKLNKTYTWDYERPFDKSWFRVLSSSFPWTDGRIAHLVASVDITESKRNQFLIEKLAQFDYLTGLPNRRSLDDDVAAFISDKSKFGDSWFVVFCDLDGFKKINDVMGHDAGDALLVQIGAELKKLPKDSVRAYRQGGDEFVVLIRDNENPKIILKIIDELNKIYRKQYMYQNKVMVCSSSLGIAHYPSEGESVKELLHRADMAMYAAKQDATTSVRVYSDGKLISLRAYFGYEDGKENRHFIRHR